MAWVRVGDEAPDFTLKDPDPNDVSLSSFRGRRNVVLKFFPFAFSEGCTTQSTQVAGDAARYAGADVHVLGVSVDHIHAQRAFGASLGLDPERVTLLADFEPKGEVARAYGVYLPFDFSNRATFVIDKGDRPERHRGRGAGQRAGRGGVLPDPGGLRALTP